MTTSIQLSKKHFTKINLLKSFYFIVTLITCLFLSNNLWSEDLNTIAKGKNFYLKINGEVITFDLLKKKKTSVVAVNGILLHTDHMTITAQSAVWYPHSQEIYIEGDIEVKGKGFLFRANQMIYNTKTKKGIIKNPEATLKAPEKLNKNKDNEFIEIKKGRHLFIKAKNAHIINETFVLTELKITTNGFINPLYYVQASSAKYRHGKSFQSWNNVLKIKKIPILYFPYLVKDLKNNWPWVRIKLGQNSRNGLSAEMGLKLFFDDNAITATISQLELKGLKGKAQFTRNTKKSDTNIYYEGIQERWRGNSKIDYSNFSQDFKTENQQTQVITNEKRYRLKAIHKRKFLWNFSFDLEIDKIDTTDTFVWKSSEEFETSTEIDDNPFFTDDVVLKKGSYRWDYDRTNYYEGKSPESTGQLKWIYGPYFARLRYKKDINRFKYNEESNNNEELNILPGFDFNIHSQKITNPWIPLYLDGYLRAESLEKEITDDRDDVIKFSSERLSIRTTLSTKYSLFDMFNFDFFGGFDETGYTNATFDPRLGRRPDSFIGTSTTFDFDIDSNSSDNLNRFMGIYGGIFSMTARNKYDLSSNFFNFDGLIHRVIPKIEFYGSDNPNKKPNELPQFDEIDTIIRDDYMIFRLQNLVDVNTDDQWRSFFKLESWAKLHIDQSNNKWEYLASEISLKPFTWLTARSFIEFVPSRGLTKSTSSFDIHWQDKVLINITERWEEDFPWQTDFYSKIKVGERYALYGGFKFLNKSAPTGNQERDHFTEYYFAIQRRYHEVTFRVEYKRDRLFNENTFSFHVRIF
ncbi:MAG: hypothetical protein COA79_16980 [Planctomycetota bacterium]|nr:MAG: hypothetical protein COA79_16980 [Planctomycetota bacterium]